MGTLPGVAGDLVTQGRTPTSRPWRTSRRAAASPSPGSCVCLLAAGIPAQPDTEVPADLASLHGRLRAGGGAHGGGGDPRLHAGAGCRRQQRRRGGHRPLLRGVRSGHRPRGPRRARPGRGSPRRRRPPSRRCPTSWRVLVMDAFERAQRRAEAARSWLGSSPSPPTARPRARPRWWRSGFVDLVGSTAWAESIEPARPEPGADPLRVGRLDERGPRRRPGHQDDRRRGLLRRADGGGRVPDRARGLRGGRRGRGAPPGPRGGGNRSRHTPGRRLLRATREPAGPPGQDGRPRRGGGDRGGGARAVRPRTGRCARSSRPSSGASWSRCGRSSRHPVETPSERPEPVGRAFLVEMRERVATNGARRVRQRSGVNTQLTIR